jgi:hypothetical protein
MSKCDRARQTNHPSDSEVELRSQCRKVLWLLNHRERETSRLLNRL